jgi:hypothetical protein
MSEFGYIPEAPEQSAFNNKGIFSPKDIYNLDRADKWTPQLGQLELIETKTGSSVSAIDFIDIKGTEYNVHFLTINDYQVATDGQSLNLRFSDDGGSTFETANYDWAFQTGESNGTFVEYKATTGGSMEVNRFGGNATNEKMNAYVYLYNLGDSSKYSFTTSHATSTLEYTARYGMQFGSGVYHIASTINAIRLLVPSGVMSVTSASLYGIRYS